MKRTLSLLMAVLMLTAVVLTGCTSGGTTSGAASSSDASSASSEAESESSAAEENDLLAQIKEKGTISVAMEGTWAPWTYHDADDNLVGYDVEVARNIAEKLGVEVNFVEGEWDGLLAGLDDGRYDIMVNGVGVTEKRAEKVQLLYPYAYNRTAVIVRGDYDEINSMEDLEAKRPPTPFQHLCNAGEAHGATVTGVDDLNQTIELLLSGRIDATLNAEVVFADVKVRKRTSRLLRSPMKSKRSPFRSVRATTTPPTLLAAVNDAEGNERGRHPYRSSEKWPAPTSQKE